MYYVRGINLINPAIGGTTNYYLYNGHGDVVQLTDAAGVVTKEYDYDAFGNEKEIDTADTNPFRYCGEYYDAETGTYYLRARYYDPMVGRFSQQDTYGGDSNDPLSLNLYTYCNNNPVQYTDPLGNKPMLYYSCGNYCWTNSDRIFDLFTNISSLAPGGSTANYIGKQVGKYVFSYEEIDDNTLSDAASITADMVSMMKDASKDVTAIAKAYSYLSTAKSLYDWGTDTDYKYQMAAEFVFLGHLRAEDKAAAVAKGVYATEAIKELEQEGYVSFNITWWGSINSISWNQDKIDEVAEVLDSMGSINTSGY